MMVWLALASGVGLAGLPAARAREGPKSAVVGQWASDDAERIPLEFRKDGTARIGFIKKKGKWLIATGKYTVSDKGRVECEARCEGVTLREFWTLKDGVLVGARGPNPMVKWVKVKQGKKK
jgi:uncharacterized protein (TIGR03066 family)